MEQTYSDTLPNILPAKHISEVGMDTLRYINNRRNGDYPILKTAWPKLNALMMGGIEWNSYIVLGATSGAGKSMLASQLETDLFRLNPDIKFATLCFNFDMMTIKHIGRKISNHLLVDQYDMYSDKFSKEDMMKAKDFIDSLSNHNIYYVDAIGSALQVIKTIEYYYQKLGIPLLVIIDHSRLVKRNGYGGETQIIDELSHGLKELKKKLPCSILLLSQLNRDIESSDRIKNPSLHYPRRSDLFASDALFQDADYVMILHRPEILGITEYGHNGYKTENKAFLHILKNRDGVVGVLPMESNLKFCEFKEI